MKKSKSSKGDYKVGTKMGIGMSLVGVGFLIYTLGIKTLNGVVDGSQKINILFVLVGCFIITIGELMFSPIGISLFGKLTPARYASL